MGRHFPYFATLQNCFTSTYFINYTWAAYFKMPHVSYIHLKTFSSTSGGSVSILDLTDLQQHEITGVIHTQTDCSQRRNIPRCFLLADTASSSSRRHWTWGCSWSPSRSSRTLPGWPQPWPPFSLQGQSAATGIYLTQVETSHQPLWVETETGKHSKGKEIFKIYIILQEWDHK